VQTLREVKPILGFPEYNISRDGFVYSTHRSRKLLKFSHDRHGYRRVTLRKHNRSHVRFVHCLVLEAYVGARPYGMECRHLNGCNYDNRIENLCWGTKQDNYKDRLRHGTGTGGSKNGRAKLTDAEVRMIIYIHRTGLFSRKEIAGRYGVSTVTVDDINGKRTWRHIWL